MYMTEPERTIIILPRKKYSPQQTLISLMLSPIYVWKAKSVLFLK